MSDPSKDNDKEKEQHTKPDSIKSEVMTRPDVVDAKVYKLKSAFVKKSVFITLSYTQENGQKRPKIQNFVKS